MTPNHRVRGSIPWAVANKQLLKIFEVVTIRAARSVLVSADWSHKPVHAGSIPALATETHHDHRNTNDHRHRSSDGRALAL